jgi:hypothetical protein
MSRYLDVAVSHENCDAVIIEGGSVLSQFKMDAALQLWKGGHVQHIIVSLNELEDVRVFALKNYSGMISSALDSAGIPRSCYHILQVYAPAPFTYHMALEVAKFLHQKELHSTLIVHDSIHIRRSYLTYKAILSQFDIRVYPYSVELKNNVKWWRTFEGIRRVSSEYVKLIYYWMRGWI